MRKMQFPLNLDPIISADSKAGRGPFPNTIDSKKSCFLVRRGKKRRGGVGFMMFGKNYFSLVIQLLFNQLLHPDLFFYPDGNRLQEGADARRRIGEIGMEQTVELEKRFFVKSNVIHFAHGHVAFTEAVFNGAFWEARIVLFASEP